jgi:chemotaxis protein CheZ
MAHVSILKPECGAGVEALRDALRLADETAFIAAMDRFTHMRAPGLDTELRKLAGKRRKALERFNTDSRLADIAENEIPDARARFARLIKLTDETAHTTLDVVEQSGPLATRTTRRTFTIIEAFGAQRDRATSIQDFEDDVRSIYAFVPLLTAIEAFLPAARADSERIRSNLVDVLLAHGYQDLTCQITASVTRLVEELATALANRVQLVNGAVGYAAAGVSTGAGSGTVVSGVTNGATTSGEREVDALPSDLGI